LHCIYTYTHQAEELSDNSLISEIFVSTLEKDRQIFLMDIYAFRDFFKSSD
jgi:hypothetical protein